MTGRYADAKPRRLRRWRAWITPDMHDGRSAVCAGVSLGVALPVPFKSTMQPQEVSAELNDFIRKEIGLPPEKPINPSDTLEDDFGITGDDADDFMGSFSKRFNVSPGDFDFHRYCEMEGFSVWPFSIFDNWLHRRWGIKKYDQREPLTVAMLQRAIDLGIWDSQSLKELGNPPASE